MISLSFVSFCLILLALVSENNVIASNLKNFILQRYQQQQFAKSTLPPTYCVSPQTGYAKSEESATCSIGNDPNGGNNWAWSNGPFSPGQTDVFQIWAGAGQCDTSNGGEAGTGTVLYSQNGDVTISFELFSGFTMQGANIYIGKNQWPPKLAPGQFPYSIASTTSGSFTYGPFSGPIYYLFHADNVGGCGAPPPTTLSPSEAPSESPTTASPSRSPTLSPR